MEGPQPLREPGHLRTTVSHELGSVHRLQLPLRGAQLPPGRYWYRRLANEEDARGVNIKRRDTVTEHHDAVHHRSTDPVRLRLIEPFVIRLQSRFFVSRRVEKWQQATMLSSEYEERGPPLLAQFSRQLVLVGIHQFDAILVKVWEESGDHVPAPAVLHATHASRAQHVEEHVSRLANERLLRKGRVADRRQRGPWDDVALRNSRHLYIVTSSGACSVDQRRRASVTQRNFVWSAASSLDGAAVPCKDQLVTATYSIPE